MRAAADAAGRADRHRRHEGRPARQGRRLLHQHRRRRRVEPAAGLGVATVEAGRRRAGVRPDRRPRRHRHAGPRRAGHRRRPRVGHRAGARPGRRAAGRGPRRAGDAGRDPRRRRDDPQRDRQGRRGRAWSSTRTTVPVRAEVRGASELLGIDPLYVACEGRIVVVVDGCRGRRRRWPRCARTRSARDAAVIGRIDADPPGHRAAATPRSAGPGSWTCWSATRCRGSAEPCTSCRSPQCVVDAIVDRLGDARVPSVRLEIGGCPAWCRTRVRFCFDLVARTGTSLEGARLDIDEPAGPGALPGLRRRVRRRRPDPAVPAAAAPTSTVLAGRELRITSVEVARHVRDLRVLRRRRNRVIASITITATTTARHRTGPAGTGRAGQNDELAAAQPALARRPGLLAINLMSSPGAGKTTLLERTDPRTAGELPVLGDRGRPGDRCSTPSGSGHRLPRWSRSTPAPAATWTPTCSRAACAALDPRRRARWCSSRTSATWSARRCSTSARPRGW